MKLFKYLLLIVLPFTLCMGSVKGIEVLKEVNNIDDLGSGFEQEDVEFENKITIVEVVLVSSLVSIVVICTTIILIKKLTHKNDGTIEFVAISNKKYNKLLPNINRGDLINNCYQIFLSVKRSYMNFDYETIRSLTTSSLFDSLKERMDNLRSNNSVNEFHEFKLVNANVMDIVNDNGTIYVTMFIVSDFYDFITSNGEIRRGFNNSSVVHYYKVTYIINDNGLIMSDILNMNKGVLDD